MIEHFGQKGLSWLRAENPTTDEVHEIMAVHALPPSLVSDLTGEVPRGGVIAEGDFIKVTMDFPIIKRKDIDHPHEVKFIFSKSVLVTTQYEDLEAIDRFKKEFEVVIALGKTSHRLTGTHLFFSLLHELYSVVNTKLDYMEAKLVETESSIFDGREKQMVYVLSEISKSMIAFRHTIRSHETILDEIMTLVDPNHKNEISTKYREIYCQYSTILRRMNSVFEILEGLKDTNMALLTTKQNEIMKTLTIMAFITFPLTLFTSTFGMNTKTTPIVGHDGDFWIIVGIMTIVTITFFSFFKYKRWV